MPVSNQTSAPSGTCPSMTPCSLFVTWVVVLPWSKLTWKMPIGWFLFILLTGGCLVSDGAAKSMWIRHCHLAFALPQNSSQLLQMQLGGHYVSQVYRSSFITWMTFIFCPSVDVPIAATTTHLAHLWFFGSPSCLGEDWRTCHMRHLSRYSD